MAIDKPLGFIPAQEEAIEQLTEMQIEESMSDDNITMMEDGSAIIGEQEQVVTPSFDMNIAEVLDDDTLNLISSELRQAFEDDKASRKDWEETYKKGLDLLGFKYTERSQPFQGASSVTHPMLSEAITQFQAQAYKELLPSGGPVNTQILGNTSTQKKNKRNVLKIL